MVVVLPAPLGPRNPVTSPDCAVKEMPLTAVTSPYFLTRFSTSIIRISPLSANGLPDELERLCEIEVVSPTQNEGIIARTLRRGAGSARRPSRGKIAPRG